MKVLCIFEGLSVGTTLITSLYEKIKKYCRDTIRNSLLIWFSTRILSLCVILHFGGEAFYFDFHLSIQINTDSK